jgi:hypothetical protein
MGSAASTKKGSDDPSSSLNSRGAGLMAGFEEDGANIGAQIATKKAEERLQKVAFDGDKPGYKDSFREYSSSHGMNKAPQVEWSDQPAPPKQKSSSSLHSNNSFKSGSSPIAPRSKPTTPITNPNIGKAAPPTNAGRSPMGMRHEVVQVNGQTATLAPSALGPLSAPMETAPPAYSGYSGDASQRSQHTGTGTVFSAAVPVPVPILLPPQRKHSGAPVDPAAGRSPLVGNARKQLESRPFPRRPSASSEAEMSQSSNIHGTGTQGPFRSNMSSGSSHSQMTTGTSKPSPPAGLPPHRTLSRGDSELNDGEGMMADFSISTKIAENTAVSMTTPKDIPILKLAPVAAQAAIRNQPPPRPTYSKPGQAGHKPGHAVKREGLPNNVAPPPGSGPTGRAHTGSRGDASRTPATINTTASGGDRELMVKKFPHSVKETKDVKRNRAQIPTQLTHAKPTTGDWLKKRYIVNNYIMLDTLGTGSYGEVNVAYIIIDICVYINA